MSEVYIEPNGRFSIIPSEKVRPSTPKDLNLNPKQTKPAIVVVSDGTFITENLHEANVTEQAVRSAAKAKGSRQDKDIFLATADDKGQITVFLRTSEKPVNDIFQ